MGFNSAFKGLMLIVKSNIFWDSIKYTKHAETNVYSNNSYMCWLDIMTESSKKPSCDPISGDLGHDLRLGTTAIYQQTVNRNN
jgi:hypothetical protein